MDDFGGAISVEAAELLAYARERWTEAQGAPGVLQWMLATLEASRATVALVAPGLGDLDETQRSVFDLVHHGDTGLRVREADLLAHAAANAHRQGYTTVSKAALVSTILALAGFPLGGVAPDSSHENDAPPPDTAVEPSLLDSLGFDLTRAAREGRLGPVVGRDDVITLVVETLCRRSKRNPALLGPAGVGKTAIVEGLAQRIAAGDVPAPLRGARIVSISAAAIVAGCKLVGEVEARTLALLREASAAGVILFIDEAHTLVGAGAGSRGGNDLANLFKPALARGEVACIAATTDDEYRVFIEADAALERRFQPVHVPELSPEDTRAVLRAVRDSQTPGQGVAVPDALLEWIIGFAGQYLRNRHFPDKAIDILEQCIAHGLTTGVSTLTQADAETVAMRMVGMPRELAARLACLRETLAAQSALPPATIAALMTRLEVTLRGVDLRPARPNAVVLLLGEAAAQGPTLAELLAGCLYGDAARVVSLDWARFTQAGDLTLLLGAPPGYVGYQGPVPLHAVQAMPWCVLCCDHVAAAAPTALDVLARGLREGYFAMADGSRVFLSDAIVLLTVEDMPAGGPIGFTADPCAVPDDPRARAARLLDDGLLQCVDIICDALNTGDNNRQHWLRDCLLAGLTARFHALGVQVYYDASVYAWLLAQGEAHFAQADWERLVDEHLCPAILPYLPAVRPAEDVRLQVTVEDGQCVARGVSHASL